MSSSFNFDAGLRVVQTVKPGPYQSLCVTQTRTALSCDHNMEQNSAKLCRSLLIFAGDPVCTHAFFIAVIARLQYTPSKTLTKPNTLTNKFSFDVPTEFRL